MTLMYEYKNNLYPSYLRDGNACRFIVEVAKHFCVGNGLDVGAGQWPLPGARPVDLHNKIYGDAYHALKLPEGPFDYIFSSHCLEHLDDPVKALRHWKGRLVRAGCLFLYLPHPDMEYWLPQNCLKHRHSWRPEVIKKVLQDLDFVVPLISERDMMWSFTVVAYNDYIDTSAIERS